MSSATKDNAWNVVDAGGATRVSATKQLFDAVFQTGIGLGSGATKTLWAGFVLPLFAATPTETPLVTGTQTPTLSPSPTASFSPSPSPSPTLGPCGSSSLTSTAGLGTAGYSGDGGPAIAAELYDPYSVAFDSQGRVYFSEYSNATVRRIDLAGNIATVAGTGVAGYNGDGPATARQLSQPYAIAISSSDQLYIADAGNVIVRQVDLSTGMMATICGTQGTFGNTGDGGPASAALLGGPRGLAFNNATGDLYVVDAGYGRVRRIGSDNNIYAYSTGGFFLPQHAALDSLGRLYVANAGGSTIRRIPPGGGVSVLVAGNGGGGFSGDGGLATLATLNYATGVAVDSNDDFYIIDQNNNRVRKVALATGIIQTVAGKLGAGYTGDGSPATNYNLNSCTGAAFDFSGRLWIADTYNQRIRRLDFEPPCPPTPTPSFTDTPSPLPTDTDSPTSTPSETSTPSFSHSPTATPSASPTDSATPSPTATPSASPTHSPTSSPTVTQSRTPSAQLDLVSALLIPAAVCVGEAFTLVFSVQNIGSGTASNVSITSTIKIGTAGTPALSGPLPASATLGASLTGDFTYTGLAAAGIGPGPWGLGFMGTAWGSDDATGQSISDAGASNTISVSNCPPTSTATPSATDTFTFSETLTASPSPTPSSSSSATLTSSPSYSASQSASPTLSETPSHTMTPTLSTTLTQTPSASGTESASPSESPTDSPTASPTATPSASATHSPVNTATETQIDTGTPTPMNTGTNTPVDSATATPVDTGTATPADTGTATPVNTGTATAMDTATATPADTGTATPADTGTATPVNTGTATAMDTATATPADTGTATPADTGTATPVNTGTATAMDTATATPADTGTATPADTGTATPVNTGTATALDTATATPVDTGTSTPVNTGTATAMDTATATPADTGTATPADTGTATPMNTGTETPMDTATATPVDTGTATPMDTATVTPADTGTSTPVDTGTATPADSPTLTPLDTATATPQDSATSTASVTPSPDLGSPTHSPTLTESPTLSPSPSITPAVTATFDASNPAGLIQPPLGSEGPTILRLLPYPQPHPLAKGHIYVELLGNADSFEISVFTPALALAMKARVSGPAGPGHNFLPFDPSDLAQGVYFLRLTAEGKGKKHSVVQKLYLAR